MKIMSNEMLVAAYRDAKNKGQDEDWIRMLKDEVRKRGMRTK